MDALDREESAAEAYAQLVRRVSQVIPREHERSEPLAAQK
jgi:hypothetical protein